MVRLSFIVPVYNVEQYLRKCVYSLIHQDFEDYEIVLVDDGSTDESGKICDELSESIRDERLTIRVIHQANAGLSAARNAGVKVAKGEYVCFVDSDDYWDESLLGELMEQVGREQLDVLRFDYRNVNEKYEVYLPNKYPRYTDTQVGVVAGDEYLNTRMGYSCYAVMFVIKRDLIISNQHSVFSSQSSRGEDCLFTEGIHFEDVDWLPRMMLRARRVKSTTTIVYNYLIRQGSITQVQGDAAKIKRNLEDNFYVLNTLMILKQTYPNCRWLANMASMIASGVLVTVAAYFFSERKEYIKRLDTLNVFPLTIANQGKTYRRRAKLINLLGPQLYCMLMHLRR